MKTYQGFILILMFLFFSCASSAAIGKDLADLFKKPNEDVFGDIFQKNLAGVKEKIEKNPKLLESNAPGRTPLGLAVYVDSPEIFDYLINKGANPNVMADDTFDCTALFMACGHGNDHMVEKLLEKGADPNVKCEIYSDTTPLYKACDGGFEKIAGMLLNKGAKIDETNEDGRTALHAAALYGYSGIVKMLLDKGANVNLREYETGCTPLLFACSCAAVKQPSKDAKAAVNYPETIAMLLKKGARVNEMSFDGETPLKMVGQIYGDSVKSTVRQILAASGAKAEKASPCAKDIFKFIEETDTVKLEALITKFPEATGCRKEKLTPLADAVIKKRNAIVELMLKKGADPNDPSFYDLNNHVRRSSPMHLACAEKNIEAVKILLADKRTNLNVTDVAERTPLMIAAEKGYAEIVKLLVEKNADVKGSALHYMAKYGYAEIVELLIQKGANVNATLTEATIGRQKKPGITLTNGNETPADWAAANNQQKVLEILQKHRAKSTKAKQDNDIHEEAMRGDVKKIKQMLTANPALLNAKSAKGGGMTPLHAAMAGRSNAAALYLIEKGADINAPDDLGRTPLFYALERNKTAMVKLLIEKGANVNHEAAKKLKPIHIAAGSGAVPDISKKSIYMLLAKGAEINAQTADGMTPLHACAFNGDVEVAKFLLAHGASRGVKDKNGLDAAATAEKLSHKETADFIKNCDIKKLDTLSTDELLLAADAGNLNAVKKILEKLPSAVSARENRTGNTPLHIAAMNGDAELIKLLVASKADISAANGFGRTPLEVIADTPLRPGHAEAIKILTEKGAAIGGARTGGGGRRLNDMGLATDLMISAIQNGQKRIVEMILTRGVDMKTRSMDKFTFLHYAAISGRNDIAALLIDKGAEIDPKGMRDMTPLYIAAASGNAELTKLLISKKADVNAVTTEGKTAIITARETGLGEIVTILEQAGAK